MKLKLRSRRSVCVYLMLGGFWYSSALFAQETFQVNLNQDGETIGDMRPAFLQYRSQALPAISPREVARRYQLLFEQSDEPEVRIDALNRLSNLQAVASEDLQFSPEKEQQVYQDVLGSYDEILARGAFQGRLDELLYQMAKAHAFVGQGQRSVARLKQLIGLYPQSPLVPEAQFRVAEAAFSAGEYVEAETMYKAVLAATEASSQRSAQSLNGKARYMLGWSQYKQDAYVRAGETFISVLDTQTETTQVFRAIPNSSSEVIDDTFRIIAIMSAKSGGEVALKSLLDRVGDREYADLLYDRLADYYASTGEYQRSVAVANGFIQRNPDHRSIPAFRAQNVDVFLAGGLVDEAWRAREAYVQAYSGDQQFRMLEPDDRQRWQEYSRQIADRYYHQAGQLGAAELARRAFHNASGFYAGLADRSSAPGEVLRLAGDAALQAGEPVAANGFFQRAGYQAGEYSGAADAAWASLTLERKGLESNIGLVVDLPGYAADADRFAAGFPEDRRVAEVQADVANRLLRDHDYANANRFAGSAIANSGERSRILYSSWLVVGEAQAALGSYSESENAWRQALALAGDATLAVADSQREALTRQLATSIYRQGEMAVDAGNIDVAIAHFQRIESVAPHSEYAIKGRFDAANTMLRNERWQPAINELQRFRADYPFDPLTGQVTEKLVYAYQASDQPIRAAEELVETGQDDWGTRLRAAELYHMGGAESARNAIYKAYLTVGLVAESAESHVKQQRIRQRLVDSGEGGDELRAQIVDKELASSWHSDETLDWAAQSALVLGVQAAGRFESIALTQPLPDSLSRKQLAMEVAKDYFGKVEQLASGKTLSEALYRRAELYRVMAHDLIASSRPGGLTDLEAEQYDMLLEEQAYPFEELAIELHSQNHQQLAQGHFDQWIELSIKALAKLYPGRYARDMRWMSWGEGDSQEGDDA